MPDPLKNQIPIEEQFRIMADTAPVMVWISATDKLCYFFNAGWLQFTGRKMEEEVGNGWAEGVHPDDYDRCIEVYTTSFENREAFRMEYRLRRHDGEYRWLLDNGVPRYTEAGEFAGYIGSCIDIHDMVEAEYRKNEFIGAASHELKTPVTTMQVYMQMLEQQIASRPDSKAEVYVKKVNEQIKKLTKLINSLLDLTKMEAGKTFLEKQWFNFQEFLMEGIETAQAVMPSHQIKYSDNCTVSVLVTGSDFRRFYLTYWTMHVNIHQTKTPFTFRLNRTKDR